MMIIVDNTVDLLSFLLRVELVFSLKKGNVK